MAKVTINAITSHFRGRVGDLIFKRYGDKLVVTRVPKFRQGRKASKKQTARQKSFSAANRYALAVLKDPARCAAYAPLAKKRQRSIQVIAISDFLTAPKIGDISTDSYHGGVGDPIFIGTDDGLKVTALQVALYDATGGLLEKGAAEKHRGLWRYIATRRCPSGNRVRIDVHATDRPGHTARKTEMFVVE